MVFNSRFKDKIRSNFFEYFYYFLIISFLTTAVLGSILYFYFSDVMQKETIQNNDNVITQLKNSQELILSEIDNTIANIVLDPFLMKYESYYEERDISAIRSIENKIDNATALCEYIDSVYVYYTNGKFVLSSISSYTPVNEFYDEEYIQKLMSQKIAGSRMQYRKILSQDLKQSKYVLSVSVPIPVNPNGNLTALAVINIKPQYLYDLIDYINIKDTSSMIIADEQGNIISEKNKFYNPDEKKILSSLPNNMYKSPKYEVLKINNVRNIVSYISSDKYKLRFIYIIPLTAINEKIQIVRKIIIIVCSMVILLGILSSYFLSRRMYAPIKKIMSLLNLSSKTEDDNSGRSHQRETTIIEGRINQLIDNNKSLHSVLMDYNVLQKNKFLQKWLLQDVNCDISLVEKLKEYGIDIDYDGGYVVFLISADRPQDYANAKFEEYQSLIYAHISDKFINNILMNFKGFVVEVGINEIAAVVSLPSIIDSEADRERVYNLAEQFHSALLQDIGYTFTLGISELAMGLDKVHSLYLHAEIASNYRLVLGNNNIILYENIEKRIDNKPSYPFFIEKEIMNALKKGDSSEVKNLLEKFTEYVCENANKEVELIRYYFLQLLSASIKCVYEVDRNIDVLLLNQNEIYTAILKEETINHMQGYIQGLYDSVLSLSEKKKSAKSQELVQSVIKYINENLCGDLSTEKLAERFYISASTLRKVFKEEMGSTVKDYIINIKMDRAKQLLQVHDIKIADISEEVGYLSVHAFTKAFKLEIGKTPGEYRNDWLNNRYS